VVLVGGGITLALAIDGSEQGPLAALPPSAGPADAALAPPADAAIAHAPAPAPSDAAVLAAATPPDAGVRRVRPKNGGTTALKTPDEPDPPPPPPPDKDPLPPPAAGNGELRLGATPSCEVFIDGKSVGHTDLKLALPSGKHQLRLKNEQYGIDRSYEIDIKPGEITKKRFDFPLK
jgi:hypothetical protein